jgi:hypothetical protein
VCFMAPRCSCVSASPQLIRFVLNETTKRVFVSLLQNVAKFIRLGETVTNWNYMEQRFKGRKTSANICYCSVQSLLSSRLLIILPFVLYECETWPLTLGKT